MTFDPVRRDVGYSPTIKRFNRFKVGSKLNLFLPQNLAKLDDEFNAYLQQGMNGSSEVVTFRLTCTGAG